jgi:hypothetical protein
LQRLRKPRDVGVPEHALCIHLQACPSKHAMRSTDVVLDMYLAGPWHQPRSGLHKPLMLVYALLEAFNASQAGAQHQSTCDLQQRPLPWPMVAKSRQGTNTAKHCSCTALLAAMPSSTCLHDQLTTLLTTLHCCCLLLVAVSSPCPAAASRRQV